jgi:phage terminase large subunit
MHRLEIPLTTVFRPLVEQPARYRVAYGGRGSGKSHFMAVVVLPLNPGAHVVCFREVRKTLVQSAKRIIENKI